MAETLMVTEAASQCDRCGSQIPPGMLVVQTASGEHRHLSCPETERVVM